MSQNTEVLEPEVEEIPLEQVIDNTLVKHNVTDSIIATLKEKYGGLKLKTLDDKEGYLAIKEARKEVRKVGILTEKLCKKGREDAVAIQKKWLSKEKEILNKIDEVEVPLNNEIDRYEKEVERKELEEKKRQEGIFISRQAELFRLGATYNDGSIVLNHISYETDLLRKIDDEQWNDTVLPKYKKVYEEAQAALVEEENKRKAEQERLKKEREELEEQQRVFKQQQDELAKQQKMLQQQKEEADKKEQQRIANERNTILRSRMDKLMEVYSLGDTIWYNNSLLIKTDELIDMDAERFTEFSIYHNQQAEIIRKEAEEKRLAKVEEEKNAAIQKALAEDELKKQQEEQRKAEELAKSSDKSKWLHFVSQLNAIALPPMSSGTYKGKLFIAQRKIGEISAL